MEKEKDPRGGPNRGQGRKKVETGTPYPYKPCLEADKILKDRSVENKKFRKKTFIDNAIIHYSKWIESQIEEADASMDEYINGMST